MPPLCRPPAKIARSRPPRRTQPRGHRASTGDGTCDEHLPEGPAILHALGQEAQAHASVCGSGSAVGSGERKRERALGVTRTSGVVLRLVAVCVRRVVLDPRLRVCRVVCRPDSVGIGSAYRCSPTSARFRPDVGGTPDVLDPLWPTLVRCRRTRQQLRRCEPRLRSKVLNPFRRPRASAQLAGGQARLAFACRFRLLVA